MTFGINRVELIGCLGADVTANRIVSARGDEHQHCDQRVLHQQADRREGDRTEWYRIVTFQPGLVDMLEKNARKGRLRAMRVLGRMAPIPFQPVICYRPRFEHPEQLAEPSFWI